MSTRTLITVGVGIAAAAFVVATGGTGSTALIAFGAASGATSLLLGPEKQDGPKPDELSISTSNENVSIPVIFGTSRVSNHYIFIDEENFTSVPVKAEGAKGGGGQTSGFNYRVPLHYGLCAGPIDSIWSVKGSPGFDVFAEFEAGLTFTGAEPETFEVLFSEKRNGERISEGGTATLYSGHPDQVSTGEDSNHRGVAWMDFASYLMSGNPNPRTLLFEITRMPKVLGADGEPIAGFHTRAALSDEHDEWKDANPAAVAWEIHQNASWGKGTSVAEMDVESFRRASVFYATERIGISTAISRTTPQEFIQRLQEIFGLTVWWDGEKLRAKAKWDRAEAYAQSTTISAEDFIGSPTFSRPSLSSNANEIRLTFLNREANFERELATSMDLAHAETIGSIKTVSLQATEISNRRVAELIAHAKLREIAYQPALMSLRLRRPFSGLQPTSFVRFENDEWKDGQAVTTFWRVLSIDDDDQEAEGITIELEEDLFATSFDGISNFSPRPFPNITGDQPLEFQDLNDGNNEPRIIGRISPFYIFEPNSWATQGERAIIVGISREYGHVESAALGFTLAGDNESQTLDDTTALPVIGALGSNLRANQKFSRGEEFTLLPENANRISEIIESTGLVQDEEDGFEALTATNQGILVIGQEFIRVGFAEEGDAGEVKISNLIRGELGSEAKEHLAGAAFAFFPIMTTDLLVSARELPSGPVDIYATGESSLSTPRAASVLATPIGGQAFSGRSARPMAPELIDFRTISPGRFRVSIRPRVWGGGAGFRKRIDDDLAFFVSELSGLSLRIEREGGSAVVIPAGSSFFTPPYSMPSDLSADSLSWRPDDGTEGSGQIIIEITVNPVANLQISTTYAGLESEARTLINLT